MATAFSGIPDNRNGIDSPETSSFPDRRRTGVRHNVQDNLPVERKPEKDIEAELQKVNNSLSPFSKKSVITRINNNEEMTADSMFTYVFRLAKDISQETYGAFDITVAPLVNAWGFGFKNATNIQAHTIDSIRQFVGFEKIDLIDGKIVKKDPRVMLDCSAIAKGFGVDCVARLLDSKGVKTI